MNTKKPTHTIEIGYYAYCAYCGNRAYNLQHPITLDVIGHYCTCEGAQNELKYEEELKALQEKHEQEQEELRQKYRDKLQFCDEKLFEVKQRLERESFEHSSKYSHYCHFSTLNGKKYRTIDQLFGL